MRCLEGVLSLDGRLDKKEVRKRKLFFWVSVAALLSVSFSLLAVQDDYGFNLMLLRRLLTFFTALVSVIFVLCRFHVSDRCILVASCAHSFAILLSDLVARTAGFTTWPTFVLVVDLLLVMQVDIRYSVGTVVFTCFWIVLMTAEEYSRFGILDLPWLDPQYGEGGRWDVKMKSIECVSLPCPSKDSVNGLVHALQVFVIDFIATRGFAREILKEQATMERTINAVQDIAALLAGYDLDRVAEILSENTLPEEMTIALRTLEQNLRMYKPYLPQTCLPFDTTEKGGMEHCDEDSHSLSTMESSVSAVAVGLPALCISLAKTTLLLVNIKDTLSRLEDDSAAYSQLFTTVLQRTLRAMEHRRGMVDVFVGDRVHCSFNASRVCLNHASSALHSAMHLAQHNTVINIGIATGQVLRGDMGCDVMRRFSMVGGLVRDVSGVERAGRVFGCDILCNRLCFIDAECEHHLRLLPCRVELGALRDPEVVAELPLVVQDAPPIAGEWLYMIGGKKIWASYNTAVQRFLRGDGSAADIANAEVEGGEGAPPKLAPGSPTDVLRYPVYSLQGFKKNGVREVSGNTVVSYQKG